MAFLGFCETSKMGVFGGVLNVIKWGQKCDFLGRFLGSKMGTPVFLSTLPMFGTLDGKLTILAYFGISGGLFYLKNTHF